ncbi:unnamed protein product [Amoebophrya sp. A120]|nr:unnamed protein product [Amoebophrya sp. A120]|eukprot:GSA120T00006578001.1
MGCQSSKTHRKVEPITQVGAEGGKARDGEQFTELERFDAEGQDISPGKGAGANKVEPNAPSTASSAHDVPLPGAVVGSTTRSPTTDEDPQSKTQPLAPPAGSSVVSTPRKGNVAAQSSPSAANATASLSPDHKSITEEPSGIVVESKSPTKKLIVDGEKKSSASSSLKIDLAPVEAVDEADLQSKVTEYLTSDTKIHPTLKKAVGMQKWGQLELELRKDSNKPGAKDSPLQWLWIREAGGKEDIGLLVFRVLRLTFSNSVVIFHFSLLESFISRQPDLVAGFGGVLASLRGDLFQRLNIANLRLTLNYYEQEDLPADSAGETAYSVHKGLEAVCKDLQFRWFQLTNTADGTRGQVMNSKRNPEIDPEEVTEDDAVFSKPSRQATCPADEVKTEEEEED